MFSIHLSTVFYPINYLIQVFTQILGSHIKRLKGQCGTSKSHSKRHYLASLKTTLSKTISRSNKLRRSNLNAVN